jgi:hypothetical protein
MAISHKNFMPILPGVGGGCIGVVLDEKATLTELVDPMFEIV